MYGITAEKLTQYTTSMEYVRSIEVQLGDLVPTLCQWNKSGDKLAILCRGLLLVSFSDPTSSLFWSPFPSRSSPFASFSIFLFCTFFLIE